MDAGAGRARPEQRQPQHDRGPRQRSPSAAGRHVYSSISILFPRHFRGQGAVAGSRDRGGAGLPLPPVSAGSAPSQPLLSRQRGLSPVTGGLWLLSPFLSLQGPSVLPPARRLPPTVLSPRWAGPRSEGHGGGPVPCGSSLSQGDAAQREPPEPAPSLWGGARRGPGLGLGPDRAALAPGEGPGSSRLSPQHCSRVRKEVWGCCFQLSRGSASKFQLLPGSYGESRCLSIRESKQLKNCLSV